MGKKIDKTTAEAEEKRRSIEAESQAAFIRASKLCVNFRFEKSGIRKRTWGVDGEGKQRAENLFQVLLECSVVGGEVAVSDQGC